MILYALGASDFCTSLVSKKEIRLQAHWEKYLVPLKETVRKHALKQDRRAEAPIGKFGMGVGNKKQAR